MRASWFLAPTLGLLIASPADGAYHITSFALPSGAPTCGAAISSANDIAANSQSETPLPFVWRRGHFLYPKPVLPAGTVSFTGIDAHLTLVGTDLISSNKLAVTTEGFTLAHGATTVTSIPGAVSTALTGLNEAGAVLGTYQTTADGPSYGFIRQGSSMITLPGPVGGGSVIPHGVSADGTIVVGTWLSSSGAITGFIAQNGNASAIVYPGATATFGAGTWGPGWVAGSYVTVAKAGAQPVTHGYLWLGGKFFGFDVGGAVSTTVAGANQYGSLTGCYITAKGRTIGFLATRQ